MCGEAGCGKALNANNHSGFCAKHFYRSKQKGSGGRAKAARGPQPTGGSVKTRRKTAAPRKTNGGAVATVCVTEEALDRWWQSLDVEIKADAFTELMTRE